MGIQSNHQIPKAIPIGQLPENHTEQLIPTNKIDGKCYIGQTTGLLKNRINRHVLDSKKKNNIYFHNAIIKYGSDNFKWCILEFCYSLEELNEKEQWYIKHYNSFGDNGYNMTTGGEKCIFSDEVKKD